MSERNTGGVIGIKELDDKLRDPQWAIVPIREFFDKWRLTTQRTAVANVIRGPGGWIDTGKTRQSLTSETDTAEFPQYARVGSNLMKTRWGEYGTGLLSEDPESSHKRHWPPSAALDKWAKKKKIQDKHNPERILTGKDIARIIGIRGGLAPRRFLRNAVRDTEPKIDRWVEEMARAIERAAEASNR